MGCASSRLSSSPSSAAYHQKWRDNEPPRNIRDAYSTPPTPRMSKSGRSHHKDIPTEGRANDRREGTSHRPSNRNRPRGSYDRENRPSPYNHRPASDRNSGARRTNHFPPAPARERQDTPILGLRGGAADHRFSSHEVARPRPVHYASASANHRHGSFEDRPMHPLEKELLEGNGRVARESLRDREKEAVAERLQARKVEWDVYKKNQMQTVGGRFYF
ncbi:MAG: hypothetical protein Q9218_004143 [Villophora microphyllina]